MTDQQAADSLNTLDRSRTLTTLSASQIFEAIENADWNALTDAEKNKAKTVLSLGDSIGIGAGSKARAFLVDVFGGTNTATNLLAITTQSISRATELGLTDVAAENVREARL